jgi:hypothetical protein
MERGNEFRRGRGDQLASFELLREENARARDRGIWGICDCVGIQGLNVAERRLRGGMPILSRAE